ncbi:CBS domain-containing protein [Streptomyces sp. AC536]|nr:CBS domain-containing protein [Streptomyces buecherae]QNJ43272.1 CBS domain-containing protein [Streptomyces buecherae]
MARNVRQVMTPQVTAVSPDASLVEAAQLMRARGVGDVLVAEHGRVLGVLTDRDITVRAVADGADPLTVSCRAICTPEPVTVTPDTTVAEAVYLMRRYAVRRLPVVEDGQPLGMVSMGDLAEQDDPGSALADVSRAAPTDGHPGVLGGLGGSVDGQTGHHRTDGFGGGLTGGPGVD